MGVKSHFLLRLSNQSKQAGDKGNLSSDVPPCYLMRLSFSNHIHHLISLGCVPSRFKGKESYSWFDEPFDEAMVLFNQIGEICTLS